MKSFAKPLNCQFTRTHLLFKCLMLDLRSVYIDKKWNDIMFYSEVHLNDCVR